MQYVFVHGGICRPQRPQIKPLFATRGGIEPLMDQLLLAYLFVCFSVGLVCMGITMMVVHRTRSRVARAL